MTFLQRLGFCNHDWRDVDSRKILASEPEPTWRLGPPRPKRIIGTQYIQRCERCRKMREFTFLLPEHLIS